MRIIGLTALLAFSVTPTASQSLTAEQWRSDLAYFAKELPARHKNAVTRVTHAEFQKQVADLDSNIPKLSETQIRAGILKLVAAIGDAHTDVQSWGHLVGHRDGAVSQTCSAPVCCGSER